MQVEVDKILSLGEFKDNINKIIDDIENDATEENFYVFTKEGGKPCAALMNINYLKKILNKEKIPVKGRGKADSSKEKLRDQLNAELNSQVPTSQPVQAAVPASTDNIPTNTNDSTDTSLRLNRNNIYVNQNDPQTPPPTNNQPNVPAQPKQG